MPFPNAERVLYRKNTLENVICQLRFPPILRIDAAPPAEFQERIRGAFPGFRQVPLVEAQFPPDIAATLPPDLMGTIPPEIFKHVFAGPQGNKNYEFSSEDGFSQINLTSTFIALSTKRYARWEEFKARLQIPMDALLDVYHPAYFTRIGLRYMNLIRRSALGLEGTEWRELLSPFITGVLGAREIAHQVKGLQQLYEIQLEDGRAMVKVLTTLVRPIDKGEESFLIDSDFSDPHKTDFGVAMERLDYLNARASRLIRWAITDRLHDAMEPQSIV